MPELPEVEAMASYLNSRVSGTRILKAQVHRGRYLPEEQTNDLEDHLIISVNRRGKYLIFQLDVGFLVCHNAMSGFWDLEEEPWTFDYVEGKRTATEKDVRVSIKICKNGSLALETSRIRFHDSRLFGSLQYWSQAKTYRDVKPLRDLGPDAVLTSRQLANERHDLWTLSEFAGICAEESRSIKEVLMDQRVVAGIGNIYSTEALWQSKIDPRRSGSEISVDELARLHLAVVNILYRSINGGIDYKNFLRVYRQKKCECGQTILNEKICGRSTYFCENCQK
jgi:formamidopyrimidine-DNA glycosylase